MVALVLCALSLSGPAGCGRDAPEKLGTAGRRRPTQLTADVVSRVHGQAIRLQEVARYSKASGLDAKTVLQRLQARKLLALEAQRRGVEPDASLRLAQKKALVQALLSTAIETPDVSERALLDAYEGQPERFRPSEKRASVHVLVKMPTGASAQAREVGRRIARSAVGWLSEESFEDATKRTQRVGKAHGFEVKAEEVPATDRNGRLQREYLSALFEVSAGQVVPHIVETRYGFHAIKVTEVFQPPVITFDDARPELLLELRIKQRHQALKDLLQSLEHEEHIVRNPDAVASLAGISL